MKALKRIPRTYPLMRRAGHYGAVIAQTIIDCREGKACGNPTQIYPQDSFLERVFAPQGIMLLNTIEKVLREKGIGTSIVDKQNTTTEEKLSFLKNCVQENKRVILPVIKNGWKRISSCLFPHYVSIEGYYGDKFLVFDPSIRNFQRGFGNVAISGTELLQRWRPNPLFKFLHFKDKTLALIVENEKKDIRSEGL